MSCTCPFSSTSRQRQLAVKWLAAGRHTTDSDRFSEELSKNVPSFVIEEQLYERFYDSFITAEVENVYC
ncbi:hypothetical protein CHARACLAT_012774 [Characodon lateralis]|uniref:Uncharacterized protein n=1 Tax=Characodon lateralis TaxID=208331 RepID=A0ABU7D661_9TELE|nr:hypothetical protein [Characodon lateralis]